MEESQIAEFGQTWEKVGIMGKMDFYGKDGNPLKSDNFTEAGETVDSVVWSQGDLIYSGQAKVDYFATKSVTFTFNGANSDMKRKHDFMVIWVQNHEMVIWPDKSGNIMAGLAEWVQGDEILEWDENPESPDSDILIEAGRTPGEGKIAAILANHLFEDESPELDEIASKVWEMILMVANWGNQR